MPNLTITVVWVAAVSSQNHGWLLGMTAGIGAACGVLLFLRGFKMLRFKRLIEDTPASKVRSASMGLVELNGMPVGPAMIPAGISGDPCFYYRAIAWESQKSGKDSEWKQVADESLFVPFFLKDDTGSMLIHAQGADMDVHRNFKDEFGGSFFEGGNVPEGPVQMFLLRHGLLGKHVRLEEHCIKPDLPLFVVGTLGENHSPWPAAPEPHIPPPNAPLSPHGVGLVRSFGIGTVSARKARAAAAIPVPIISGVARPVPMVSAKAAPKPAPSATSSWKDISMNEIHPPRMPAPAPVERIESAPVAPSSFPFTPPGGFGQIASRQQDVRSDAAIAVEDAPADVPSPDSEFDRNAPVAVGKGNSDAPFTISWESRRALIQNLGWQSAACIWGGPLLTIVSAYLFFVWLGM